MCYEEENRRPIGVNEAENAWLEQMTKFRTAVNNDPYTNGGLLDSVNHLGYVIAQPFGAGPAKLILEKEFTYEELQFISRCRLQNISLPDLERLISLLNRFKEKLMTTNWETTMGNTVPGYTPSYNGWNNPNLFGGSSVQPLYGAPVPMEIPKEWMGETPSDISRRQMGTKEWDNHFASLSNDDVQKGPNEPDEQSSDEKIPSFLGSAWNDPVRTRSDKFYGSTGGFPFPEKIGEKKDQYKKRVVLSAEGTSSKEDVQKGPNEPGELKDRLSLKGILDYPSTGIKINENPVSLTEENKSVDKEEKNND